MGLDGYSFQQGLMPLQIETSEFFTRLHKPLKDAYPLIQPFRVFTYQEDTTR